MQSPTPPPLPPLPLQLSYRSTTSTSSINTNPPPPLPPLPSIKINTTNQHDLLLSHHSQMSPPPSATFWNTNPQLFNTPQQSSIFTTPQSAPYQNVYNYQQPLYQNTTITTTPQAPSNETFEAKWARIQANKKTTNPFAEDIAKKYEIKL